MNLKVAIPKGRISGKVQELLADAGVLLSGADRNYRPTSNATDMSFKLLKSQNIPKLIEWGKHDCGFAGLDWVHEHQADVETALPLGFDPVRIVACIPEGRDWQTVKRGPLLAVSEYENLCRGFMARNGIEAYQFLRSYGATEVFPPEDADLIIDNTSTGTTIKANQLVIVEEIMKSSTYFLINKRSMDDPWKRERLEQVLMLFRGILDARERVLLEMNCAGEAQLEELNQLLPCMKAPTVSRLYRGEGFALKAAVLKKAVKDLIPQLKAAGATDILETDMRKVIL